MSIIVDHKLLKHSLRGLKDVKFFPPLSDGEFLAWSTIDGKWINLAGVWYLDDLLDVEVANPQDGDVIIFSQPAPPKPGVWIRRSHILDRLLDVEISSPADGEVVTYEGATALWKNKPPPPAGAIAYQNVKGTTNVSTTSSTFVDMPDMALTVAQTGTYLIMASLCCMLIRTVSSSEIGAAFRLTLNGAEMNPRERSFMYIYGPVVTYHAGNAPMTTVRSLSAGDVVRVQWTTAGVCNEVRNWPADQHEHRELTLVRLA